MQIKQVQRYIFNGKEYNSLKEIKDEVENIIGLEVLDPINRTCPLQKHEDYFKLLELLCKPQIREVLTKYLNVTFEKPVEEHDNVFGESETVNVLDIK